MSCIMIHKEETSKWIHSRGVVLYENVVLLEFLFFLVKVVLTVILVLFCLMIYKA